MFLFFHPAGHALVFDSSNYVPLTEMGQTSGGIGLGGKIKDSLLNLVSRYQEMLVRHPSGEFSRLLDVWVWKSEKSGRETVFTYFSLNITEFSVQTWLPWLIHTTLRHL